MKGNKIKMIQILTTDWTVHSILFPEGKEYKKVKVKMLNKIKMIQILTTDWTVHSILVPEGIEIDQMDIHEVRIANEQNGLVYYVEKEDF